MGSKATIRVSVQSDVDHIAPLMREADKVEIQAFSRANPRDALVRGLRFSDICLTGLVDDEPACMFGFARESLLSPICIPWLLGTDRVMEIPFAFLRSSKQIVADVWASGDYSKMENWVDSENSLSIRWLTWLGFTIDKKNPLLLNDRNFYKFNFGGI